MDGMTLGPNLKLGQHDCIMVALAGLLPTIPHEHFTSSVFVPSYRQVLASLPMISSAWVSTLNEGMSYLVHVGCHCIGVAVGRDAIDIWDSGNEHGRRVVGDAKARALHSLEQHAPFLHVLMASSQAAEPYRQDTLSNVQYERKAGSPYIPATVMKSMKEEVRSADLESCLDEDSRWRCRCCANRHFRRPGMLAKHHKKHLRTPILEQQENRQTLVVRNFIKMDTIRSNVMDMVSNPSGRWQP